MGLKRQARQEQLDASRELRRRANEEAALRQEQFEAIRPLATALLALGIDPQTFISSALGQSILGQQREAISSEFGAARQGAVQQFANQGLTGSGVTAAPIANLFGQEAQANARALQQLPLTGLNLGLQGANILQGQQAIFNPNPTAANALQGFNSVINAPTNEILRALIGASGQAIGGLTFGGGGGGGGTPP